MAKSDRKSAFRSSPKAEEHAVRDRFNKAESVLAKPGKKGVSKGAEKAKVKESMGKVIRDSFTMPANDYKVIERVRDVCLNRRIVINKSEVLRAGIRLLDKLSNKEIVELIQSLPKVKTGRPPIE